MKRQTIQFHALQYLRKAPPLRLLSLNLELALSDGPSPNGGESDPTLYLPRIESLPLIPYETNLWSATSQTFCPKFCFKELRFRLPFYKNLNPIFALIVPWIFLNILSGVCVGPPLFFWKPLFSRGASSVLLSRQRRRRCPLWAAFRLLPGKLIFARWWPARGKKECRLHRPTSAVFMLEMSPERE